MSYLMIYLFLEERKYFLLLNLMDIICVEKFYNFFLVWHSLDFLSLLVQLYNGAESFSKGSTAKKGVLNLCDGCLHFSKNCDKLFKNVVYETKVVKGRKSFLTLSSHSYVYKFEHLTFGQRPMFSFLR